jgi:photosystem II stability/assembly factor-like uncharacterized protein
MTLYLATQKGLFIISKQDDHWQVAHSAEERLASSIAADALYPNIAVDPLKPQRLFYTDGQEGVWCSDDAGTEWRRVSEGFPQNRITSLMISSLERVGEYGVIYVGTEPSAVYRSEDSGETWQECTGLTDLHSKPGWSFPPRPETHHVRYIEADPVHAGKLFVAIEAGALVFTPDAGQTWQDRVYGSPYDTHQLATHPGAPGKLWSAAGDGFFESDDSGKTWQREEDGLQFKYCWSVAVDSADPATILLSASPSPRAAHSAERAESTIYRRTNDHEPWNEVQGCLPKSVRAYILLANPAEAGVFYAAANMDSIYRSSDAGAAWQRMDIRWPENYDGVRVYNLAVTET